MPQMHYTRRGFQDPRRPKDRFMDIISGAAREQFPPFGADDPLVKYGAPPAQESASRAEPVDPTPPAPSPAQENPNLYGSYKEALGRPAPAEKPQAKWKQALGYAAAAFRPTRGTDLPERLIVGDENLRSRAARKSELATGKELGEVAEKEEEAGIKRRTTTTGERQAAVGERGAATSEGRLQFEKDTYPQRSNIELIKVGGHPEGGKVAIPSGREGEESTYTFEPPSWDVPPEMRGNLGGAQTIPRGAVGSAIGAHERMSRPPDRFSSAGGGVIYDKTTGRPTFVKPTEQRQRVFSVGGRLVDESGKVLYEPPPTTGTPAHLIDDHRIIEQRATNQLGRAMDDALRVLIDPNKNEEDKSAALQMFDIQKQDIQEGYRREYRSILGSEPPEVPNPELPFAIKETPGMLWGTNRSVEFTGLSGGPPLGPTTPPEPPPSGPTTPDTLPAAPPSAPVSDAQLSQLLTSQGVPPERVAETIAAIKADPQALQEAVAAIQGR